MFLGYQQGKIKFYSKTPLDKTLYNLDEVIETTDEYILDGDEYVLNDEAYQDKKQAEELARINALTLPSTTFFKEVLRTSYKTKSDIQTLVQSNITLTTFQKENILIDIQNSTTFTRSSYFITTLGTLLNYTTEQLNYLFEHGVFNL